MPSSLEPLQRLRLHWPEAQQTFLLNAKRSWGTSADQFFACLPPAMAVPHRLSFLFSALNAVTVAAAPIVIRPLATASPPNPGFLAIAFDGSLLLCLSTMRVFSY